LSRYAAHTVAWTNFLRESVNLHRNHFLPHPRFSKFGVAFEVMHSHSRSMDTDKLCKITFFLFSRYLPPYCISALSRSRKMKFSFYFAIVAPGILPRAPVKSTPVRAWIAGGKVPINLFTSCVVLLPPPISTIWSVLARGADTSAAI